MDNDHGCHLGTRTSCFSLPLVAMIWWVLGLRSPAPHPVRIRRSRKQFWHGAVHLVHLGMVAPCILGCNHHFLQSRDPSEGRESRRSKPGSPLGNGGRSRRRIDLINVSVARSGRWRSCETVANRCTIHDTDTSAANHRNLRTYPDQPYHKKSRREYKIQFARPGTGRILFAQLRPSGPPPLGFSIGSWT